MEPGAQNAVMGDVNDIPVTTVPDEVLNEEKNLAKFSKSKEFNKLKEYLEGRIKFFQTQMPDGKPLVNQDHDVLVHNWKVANLVIGEFQALLNVYENANQVVTASEKRNVTR